MRRVLALAIVLVATTTAHGDRADKLFKKGKKLLAEKKYAEACDTFEDVDELDPGIGAKLNVARCYEEWGRLATAYRWYSDAEKMAAASKDDRATKIRDLLTELDTNVPRLVVKVPDGADPDVLATVTLDGKPVQQAFFNTEQRVDPGPHVIEFVLDGAKKRKTAPLERGGESEVSLDIPKGTGKKRSPNPGGGDDDDAGPSVPGRGQRIAGVSIAVGGGVALGVAGYLTISARGTYKDAISAHCMGAPNLCSPEGLTITRDARSKANVATIVSVAGAAMVAGGVILYLLAPKASAVSEHALYLTPTVDDAGGGMVFGGRW